MHVRSKTLYVIGNPNVRQPDLRITEDTNETWMEADRGGIFFLLSLIPFAWKSSEEEEEGIGVGQKEIGTLV